jgi:hypothetical protein
MPITINGSGTVTGISAGGLPDGVITTDDLASTVPVAKAWVNFNGTGTVAIRASYNVSSITDNNVGDYTVNFTTALADANYAVVATGMRNSSYAADSNPVVIGLKSNTTYTSNASTSSFSITAHWPTTAANQDPIAATVAVFR